MRVQVLGPYHRRRNVRVKAYNIEGEQVCWNGCQDSIDSGTLPSHIRIDTLLGITDWVKYAWTADGERRSWQPLGWQPAAIIHSNGILAMMNEELGFYGTTVTALSRAPSLLAPELAPEVALELAPTASSEPDLEEIRTPPTPPMRD